MLPQNNDQRPTARQYGQTDEANSSLVTLQSPLSRRGEGPGLILVTVAEQDRPQRSKATRTRTLDPDPSRKWAEEGFAVAEIKLVKGDGFTSSSLNELFVESQRALKTLRGCDGSHGFGVIVYAGNSGSEVFRQLWHALSTLEEIAAIVAHSDEPYSALEAPSLETGVPVLFHVVSNTTKPSPRALDIIHVYENVSSASFVLPFHEHYHAGSAGVSHTRSLGFLKKNLHGPMFDLEAIWDEHTMFEFGERNVEKTMATMVEEPYVNHVPTMTGGIGRTALTEFYRNHFIFNNPKDTTLELISRTVGVDRVIDEFIFCFTHTKVIDWLVPGIPPTGKPVRVPFTSVVNVRGDRLYHEHIAWDQASVLRQLGLLPEYLPFPYPLPDGRVPEKGKRFEYRVPAAGVETAEKMVDESCVESNRMFEFEVREVDDN